MKLKLGGKEYGIEINNNTLRHAKDESDLSPYSKEAVYDPAFIQSIAFYGIREKARLDGNLNNFSLTYEDVGAMIGNKERFEIVKMFGMSMRVPYEGDTEKK
ncbi:MAG: hypothetical protein NXI20_17840 [bacterium]|nr:hypothetical protein [bacterium]